MILDPDAPSRANATVREFRHWLFFNINDNDVKSGDVFFEYRGSGPPNGTSLHRYIFLLFEQNSGKIDFEYVVVPKNASVERRSTSTRTLMADFNLALIAGNYFQAEFENAAMPVLINVTLLCLLTLVKLIF